ncbi:hypothetical protein [Morganella morganii]|uniref:hypothetical protein n=1 Tax=Morganella morganii TaxID=582 RepID=UPI003EB919C8
MTVSTELSHEEYTGNGVTTDFDFRFRIFEAKHLVVSVADPDGTERILTNGTDYTLRGVGSYRGGKVILKMPLAIGWKIGIARDLPVVQETDLRNQGKFFAEVHEDALDYLTMLIQKSLGFLSLCLRKPSFISDHYDAKGNKISNLGKPVKDGDAVNLGTMKEHISAKDKRSLRVADKDIPELPNTANRANKLLSFDNNGYPVVIVPESGSAADVLAELGKPDGTKLIGIQPGGSLQQIINYVTPEQFGAIGDGVYHPLSAQFNSLSEAKEIYPHVSSLSQSIDWAACQAAENYARNKSYVRCPETAKYHFGDSDYLELQSNSRWQGAMTSGRIPSEVNCTTMIRSVPTVKPPFGRDAVVRVMDAADASSNDEFVRGIVFEGFLLTRGVPRRSIVKGKGTMCLHMNNGINSRIDVTCFGAEYGVFGYCFWGTTGRVQCDTCRIGFYADAITETPERHGNASGGSNTSFDIRVQMDVVTFGIVLRGCAYSTFTGWIEDAVIGTATYDHANETAIAITMLECNGVNIQSVGIEEWQGVFVYARRSGGDINIPYAQQYAPNNITGRRDGPYSVISSQMTPPQEQPFTLPSGDLALLYMKGNTSCTIKGMSGDMSGSNYNNIYLINLDDDAKIIFQNTGVYMGGNFARVAPGNYRSINVINDKYLIRAISPSNDDFTYDYLGWSMYRHRDFVDGQIAASGSIKINFNSNYKFIDVSAFVVAGSNTSARNYGAITCSDFSKPDNITLQTGLDVSGYALRYKITLQRK